MSQAPVMPMFVDAMLGDTLHLDSELFGAYHLILYAEWRANGQPLPDDDAILARICRMTVARWRKCRPVLAQFFDLTDGTWRQKRLEREWAATQDRARRSRENGANGGRPPKPKPEPAKGPPGNPKTNPSGNPEKTQQETQSETQQETQTVTQTKASLSLSVSSGESSPPPEKTAAPEPGGGADDAVAAMIAGVDDAIAEHFGQRRRRLHPQDRAIARGWIEQGLSAATVFEVVEPIIGKRAANGQDAPESLKFFVDPVLRAVASGAALRDRMAPSPVASDPAIAEASRRYTEAVTAWSRDGRHGSAPTREQFGLPPLDA